MCELYDKCEFHEWQSIASYQNHHELIKTALELYIKHELDLQRKNLWEYAINKVKSVTIDTEQFIQFSKIFDDNNINVFDFAKSVYDVLTKKHNKINALRINGNFNTGKTLIANCITAPFICCYMNNHGSENEFFLSNMLNKSIILCEELYITIATAEDFKSILGGQPIDIAKKFNEKQTLCRTPVIITSNYDRFGRGHIPPLDEEALRTRCKNYRFDRKVYPTCKLEWQQFYLFIKAFLPGE